ncbi:heterogeneous nuclear ribonucleoprotein H-like, partial [Diaphorina citri]|uniref:Heterogeneous nuclear ribonucleoprotein H-like n=1 Tax=Diaphorina citri TaxID=121845 RepID=A0A1S3DJQ0_DIACI
IRFGVTSRNGRPSGEAFVEVEDEVDMENALRKNKEYVSDRYIEVFKVRRQEMDWKLQHTGIVEGKKDDIAQFFDGLEIISNGITLVEDPFNGRPTGEAYVQFVDKETAELALQKHKERIGHRYIEIFKCTLEEIRASTHGGVGRGANRFGGGRGCFNNDRWNDRPGGFAGPRPGDRWVNESSGPGHHTVHMRGLPFRVNEKDIVDFFSPVVPVYVDINYKNGRPSGEADVYFATHEDAMQAMSKDRTNIRHRYIELFLNSSSPRGGVGGSGFSRSELWAVHTSE